MKTCLVALLLFAPAMLFSQFGVPGHILPCNNNHDSSRCTGWATGRSFNKTTADVCNPATLWQYAMHTSYFEWVLESDETVLRSKRIIGWGPNRADRHVAVREGHDNYSQVKGPGAAPTFNHRYDSLKAQWGGKPDGYFNEIGMRTRAVTAQNKFGDDSDSGLVKWDGSDWSSGAPKTFDHATQHSLTRVSGQVSAQNIKQRFLEWNDGSPPNDSNSTISVWVVDNNPTYSAIHKNLYDVQFQYSKPTGTFSGSIVVGGQSCSTPTGLFEVMQDNSISATATTYFEFENVGFHFSSWSPGGSTNSTSSFTPSGTTQLYTVTANFSPIPRPPAYLTAGGSIGDPVRVTWTSHSASSGVTEYQIWRKVKPKNQQEGSPQLLTTVPRTTSSYTDNAYTITSGYTDDLVSYDVRARYNAGGVSAYANPNYVSVFAAESWKVTKQGKTVTLITRPTAFSLSAQPNPFNPSTQIIYEVPEPASVQIEVFDVTGRRLAELVNADKPSGTFAILWDGRDHGKPASSGVYYCRMMATPVSGGSSVLKTARLLLVK